MPVAAAARAEAPCWNWIRTILNGRGELESLEPCSAHEKLLPICSLQAGPVGRYFSPVPRHLCAAAGSLFPAPSSAHVGWRSPWLVNSGREAFTSLTSCSTVASPIFLWVQQQMTNWTQTPWRQSTGSSSARSAAPGPWTSTFVHTRKNSSSSLDFAGEKTRGFRQPVDRDGNMV